MILGSFQTEVRLNRRVTLRVMADGFRAFYAFTAAAPSRLTALTRHCRVREARWRRSESRMMVETSALISPRVDSDRKGRGP